MGGTVEEAGICNHWLLRQPVVCTLSYAMQPFQSISPNALLVVVCADWGDLKRPSPQRESVEKSLQQLAGVDWSLNSEIQIVALTNFRGLSAAEGTNLRDVWILEINEWARKNEVASIIFYPNSPLKTQFPKLHVMLRSRDVWPSNNAEFEIFLAKALRKHNLSLRQRAARLLENWNYPRENESGAAALARWEAQFNFKHGKLAAELLLGCFRLLKPDHLSRCLNLSDYKERHPKAGYYLLGGFSDAQIRGIANRQAQLTLNDWPDSSDLWSNSSTAIVLTDWCESGRQLANTLVRSGAAGEKSALTRLKENSDYHLIIQTTWTTRLAIERVRWLAESSGIIKQMKFLAPREWILENLPSGLLPNFEDMQEMDYVIPEYEVTWSDLMTRTNRRFLFDLIRGLVDRHWPSLNDKSALGICTAWTFSAGEHNLSLFVRDGEAPLLNGNRWRPLLNDALRTRGRRIIA